MSTQRAIGLALGVLGAALGLAAYAGSDVSAQSSPAGAGGSVFALPVGGEPVRLDPVDFSTRIDNPYFPLAPGNRWVYRETDADGTRKRVVVTVTNDTRRIANGVTARVVHDVVSERGDVIEDTLDWYAEDSAGNVWYLGEDTVECENGRVATTAGSFEAGVDGAEAGVIMPARPRVGLAYRQEYYAGQAEDAARVLSLDEQVSVPLGFFGRVLMTKDFTPLEPRVLEHKFYARGRGLVLALGISGGADREELVGFTRRANLTPPPLPGRRCG